MSNNILDKKPGKITIDVLKIKSVLSPERIEILNKLYKKDLKNSEKQTLFNLLVHANIEEIEICFDLYKKTYMSNIGDCVSLNFYVCKFGYELGNIKYQERLK